MSMPPPDAAREVVVLHLNAKATQHAFWKEAETPLAIATTQKLQQDMNILKQALCDMKEPPQRIAGLKSILQRRREKLAKLDAQILEAQTARAETLQEINRFDSQLNALLEQYPDADTSPELVHRDGEPVTLEHLRQLLLTTDAEDVGTFRQMVLHQLNGASESEEEMDSESTQANPPILPTAGGGGFGVLPSVQTSGVMHDPYSATAHSSADADALQHVPPAPTPVVHRMLPFARRRDRVAFAPYGHAGNVAENSPLPSESLSPAKQPSQADLQCG